MRISDWSSDVCSSDLQRSRDRDVSHRQQVTPREMQTNTEHEEDDPDLGKLIGETGISNKARSKGTNQDASEQIARDWRDLQTMSECAHQKSHDQASNDHGNER